MHNDRLIYHGSRYHSIDAVGFVRNTHATRVQVKIYEKFQGPCVVKKGRAVTLTIDDEVGLAL